MKGVKPHHVRRFTLLSAVEEDAVERTLIAVGSRGLGAVRRLRLGSVSTKVLHAAKGPVLVYPRSEGSGSVLDVGGGDADRER
jgi:nucleotide-binding universal stress UspA family protein